MYHLKSTSIKAADYDPANRRLYIWFRDHGPYTFYRVPESVFLGLLRASSPGTYYHEKIRGRYSL